MEICGKKDCPMYLGAADNNCDICTDVADCLEAMAFKAKQAPSSGPFSDGLSCLDGVEIIGIDEYSTCLSRKEEVCDRVIVQIELKLPEHEDIYRQLEKMAG